MNKQKRLLDKKAVYVRAKRSTILRCVRLTGSSL